MSALKIIARQSERSSSASAAERLFGLTLPRAGYRAGATSWQPRDSGGAALYNRLFETDAELAQWAVGKGPVNHVWHATASFKETGEIARDLRSGFKGRRDESNIHSRQCFHGDLDCGETKPYLRFDHAKAALGWATAKLGLPSPIAIRSGNGLHFYFPLTEPITDMHLWRAYAGGLLDALVGQGLKLDAPCSTDPVRLLRPPGTLNHKNGKPRLVAVEDWGGGPVPLATFDPFKVRTRRASKPRPGINARSPLPLAEFPAILRRCRQMNNFARKLGAVSEPEWKACLGVLAFVENGREIAHAYSKGDPRYTPEETDAKFYERCKLIGPTTCRHFAALDNGLCAACTWRSPALASPLRIGEAR
jgi:hypothetical protein